MIAHIILFEPREELDDTTRALFAEIVAKAATEIPSIRRFRIGTRVTHGLPGYEQTMKEHYGYAAVIEFDDADGLREYLRHPAHAALGHHFSASSKRALAYDFDLVDVADVRTALLRPARQ